MCVDEIIKEHISVANSLIGGENIFKNIADKLISCINSGNTIFIAGNGGSASDAQHFAAELVGRFVKERKPLGAVCLNADTALITAIANDYGYSQVFKRQLEGLSKPGDVFIGITTSGKSENILNAFNWANNNEVSTIALTGNGVMDIAKSGICIPSNNTARIQELHILVIHIICKLIDDAY